MPSWTQFLINMYRIVVDFPPHITDEMICARITECRLTGSTASYYEAVQRLATEPNPDDTDIV